jgi:hypothetical protein
MDATGEWPRRDEMALARRSPGDYIRGRCRRAGGLGGRFLRLWPSGTATSFFEIVGLVERGCTGGGWAVCGIFWWVSLAVARVTGLRPVLTYVVPVGAGMKLRV